MRYFAPNYVARSFTAALSSFISFSAAFFVLLVTRAHYGTDFAITIGAVGSVFGLISVASAGFTVHTLMSSAKPFGALRATRESAGSDGSAGSAESVQASVDVSEPSEVDSDRAELRSLVVAEFRPALTMTAIVAVAALALSLWGPHIFGVSPEYFYPYWWPYLVVLLLGPLTAVIAGLTQSAAQDGFGLWVSVLSTGLTVASAIVGIVIGLDAHIALALIGVTSVAVRLLTVAMRLSRLREFRIGIVAGLWQAARPGRARGWRDFSPLSAFLTTIDGFVFLLTYTVAISVASHHSPADGAMVALIVSLMRALIVPIKQLGIVGGRMSRQSRLAPAEATEVTGSAEATGSLVRRTDLRVVTFSSSVVTTSAGVLALILMLTGVIHISPLPLMLLVTAQVLCEPWAGILFSFLKVASGPKLGLSALVVSYLGLGVLGLLVIDLTGHGEAVTVWAWMVVIRLVFMGFMVRPTRRWIRDGSAAAPVRAG
ncbi:MULTISPECIES: hypothetical protein [unclassified Brevibacterium]|uniref:hypothetical protein n=1 Tax=unclassified Brevibacterium TaxID=2614124 RepID=UPI001E5F9982|nr:MULTISPECIES: hypothetical protein [unclassified Brevibacterium]MCD1285827.1 hypothetical protein [Brevibacterium sp. CCUG 69071]MDK8434888.1 hypothetical protein [Brevibacterium sp. H-BE7]